MVNRFTDDAEIFATLYAAASGKRHKHYAHVCAKNKLYLQLVAGVGIDELLKQYVRRESTELFKQRVELTNHIVTSVAGNLLAVFNKVPRSNNVLRFITYENGNKEQNTARIENKLKTFWGSGTLEDYTATRFLELNATDPNAFVVFEWRNEDGEINPYPFEVNSAAAVDYHYTLNRLDYLITHGATAYISTEPNTAIKTEKQGSTYTFYGKDKTVKLTQINGENLNIPKEKERYIVTIDGQPVTAIRLEKNVFAVSEYVHNLGEVPAERVGYFRDLATGGETYVNQLHPIEPYLLKTLKTNSELDLVATLLAMPQQISYGEACDDVQCYGGKYDSGATCGTCGGSGLKRTAASSQDAIRLKMPASKEELIPLGDIIRYVSPPVDIVLWQEEYINRLTEKAKKLLFNSDVFDRGAINNTATGATIDMQNVYDTLYPFAIKYAAFWRKMVTLTAGVLDIAEGLIAVYSFGKDFKLKTTETLIRELKEAANIGNAALVQHLNADIANIVFSEKPLDLQKFKVKEAYNPFSGKTQNEILYLLSSPFVPNFNKVLYANLGNIFDTLEAKFFKEGGSFYQLPAPRQKEAVEAAVNDILKIINNEADDPQINFNND